ncbi:MAG: MlaD family protein [Planctomycetota bacterium]
MHRVRYFVGVLTLVAVVAGAFWLVHLLRRYDDEPGVLVQVEFKDVRGLRTGADVRFRGVHAGTVREVRIADGGQKAVVRAILDPAAAVHARLDSVFWIVTPRFAGLTSGVSGLDTLVRDAYLAFQTAGSNGSPLAAGSLITGSERPPSAGESDSLDEVEHGDLLMQLLLPENHGLRPGSAVTFRGVRTGEVRDVTLAADGTHVVARVRIDRAHRQTVTDKAQFWVARPQLSGALFTGFTVNDVGALLAPFISYYGDAGKGVPVEDGFRAVALAERPDIVVAPVPGAAVRWPEPVDGPPAADGIVLVRIVYAATERDTWSPDDPVHAESTGVFYLDRAGRPVVVTARSGVDGNYTEHDAFGMAPDIDNEQIQIVLPTGSVVQGGRVWVNPKGADLAVLLLTELPKDVAGTPPERLRFDDAQPQSPVGLRRAQADGRPEAPVPLADSTVPALAENRGAAVVAGDQVIGIYGHAVDDDRAPTVVPLHLLPADLQPR